MIRFQNRLREMRTYEIPIQAGAGLVRQKVEVVRRTLTSAGEGQPSGSRTVQSHRETFDRKFPRSITLAAAGTPGDTSDELPDNLQHVEPFKSALAGRQLVVVPVAAPKEVAAASPPPSKTSRPPADAPASPAPDTSTPAEAGTTPTKRGK